MKFIYEATASYKMLWLISLVLYAAIIIIMISSLIFELILSFYIDFFRFQETYHVLLFFLDILNCKGIIVYMIYGY